MPAEPDIRETPVRARGRPTLADVAAIESRLLEVALREFTAHGYGGSSMARIVRTAGISKTTLYSRFSSKEELFRAIMRHQIGKLAASNLLLPAASAPDLEQGLRSYANRALEFSMRGEMLEVNRLIYSESHRFPELGAAACDTSELGIVQIADFIALCAEADGIACRDPRAVAESFIFQLRGWYADILMGNRKVTRTMREAWVARAVDTLVSAREDW